MLIQELLAEPMAGVPSIGSDLDPLQLPWLFQESQVVDVRINALRSTAAVLLELRAAFDSLRGNTGIIVMRGIRSFYWKATETAPSALTAWVVVGATVAAGSEGVEVGLGLSPNAKLAGLSEVTEYYALDADIGAIIPDYLVASNNEIQSSVATWESTAVPIECSTLRSR